MKEDIRVKIELIVRELFLKKLIAISEGYITTPGDNEVQKAVEKIAGVVVDSAKEASVLVGQDINFLHSIIDLDTFIKSWELGGGR